MKKRLIFLTLIFLAIFSILIIAETPKNTTELQSTTNQNSSQVIIIIQDKTNAFLSQETKIPEEFKGALRILFGLEKTEPLPFQKVIIFTALWIMLLLLIQSALESLPFFGKGAKSWIGAIIVASLASTTGAIKITSSIFFSLEENIKFLTAWSVITTIINLLIFTAFFFGVKSLLKSLKDKAELMKAEQAGLNTGISSKI